MKKKWIVILSILTIFIIAGLWFFLTPVDIRPVQIRKEIQEEDFTKGSRLLKEMQDAYGGIEYWKTLGRGSYAQEADWYDDKLGVAGWDTNPQKFEMTSFLGSDDSQFKLLNGANKDQTWGVEDWKTYELVGGLKEFVENEKYQHKLIYKNYWFQFPFRISEAPIIAYAGESTVKGETYDLLYATWGSESANTKFDQYVLYIDKETKLVEWLNFTLREKFNFMNITAKFTDFKKVNGITCPFSQYITIGNPEEGGRKMHENRYQWIEFGGKRVERL